MGEYATDKTTGQEIKIGTCESMYYLRYEDRNKVRAISGNVDPARELNLFWRLPFPDEDHYLPGVYEQHNRGERLGRQGENGYWEDFSDPETIDSPGNVQLHHSDSGMHVNMACYHGLKLPEATSEMRPFWNGKGSFFELAFVKNTADGVFPVVRCRHCGEMWRYTWDDILPWIADEEMRKRLEKHQK